MSNVFPKNKEKRPRTSSGEASTSFVKNVTSRVSGFLPSTITKWFSSPSSSNTNGSAPTADATDSSTEDEAPETQPPTKRMRYNTGKYNHFGSTEANTSSTSNVEMTEMPFSPFSSTQYAPRSTITATPIRTPNEDSAKDKADSDTSTYKSQQVKHTVASIGQSIANRRKSIFDTTNRKEDSAAASKKPTTNTSQDLKQPYFKPTLLGSPFYPGRTMYGGASASYINEPNIRQQKVALVSESKSNEDSALSSSARRIMDLLESYSSPLSEARRIPQYTRPKNNSFDLSSDRGSPYSKPMSHRTQELYVPSMASILRLKKNSRLMDTTKAARQIIASHSSSSNYPSYSSAPEIGKEPDKEPDNKMTTKMKSRLTRVARGNQEDLDVASPMTLPAVSLNIDKDKLPNFGASPITKMAPATSTPKTTVPTSDNKTSTKESMSKLSTPSTIVASNCTFKFSNPVRISFDGSDPDRSLPKFVFDSPERQVEQKLENKDKISITVRNEKTKSPNKSSNWNCKDCWVSNKPESEKCVCCGAKKPSAKPICSVCKVADCQSQKDKCVECANKGVSQVATSSLSKPTVQNESSKWSCADCWVKNECNAVKCVCCGSPKPGSKAAPAPAVAASEGPSPAKDWTCADCWVTNKPTLDKCVACGGAKPGVKKTNTAPSPAPGANLFGTKDDTFKKLAANSSSKWSCPSCLVQNDKNKNSCVCCGAEQVNTNKTAAPQVKFNFGKNLPTFKFGIDPKLQETATATKSEVPSTITKPKEPSETNNNVLAETPSFTFGLPKKVDNKSEEALKVKSVEAPKDRFTFGIPKQTSTLTAKVDAPKPAEPAKVVEEEKPQEVPTVNLTTPVQDKPKFSGKLFASPVTQSNENKTLTALPSLLPAFSAKKDTTGDAVAPAAPVAPSIAPATMSEKPKSVPTFTFGVKTTANTFTTPTTTAAATNLFAAPATPASATTAANTMSMFKAPETSSTAPALFGKPSGITANLFQKNEATTTAAATVATPKPMFSFGSSSMTPAPAAAPVTSTPSTDKPQFQFSFGATSTPKAESSPFKTPFGNENSTFSLPTTNALGNNTLTLGGNNGMPVANGLTGNTLSGNTLTGSGLSGHTITGSTQTGNSLIGNTLGAGNPMTSSNPLGGVNGLSASTLGGGNGLQTGNALGGSTELFGNTVQKENVWSTSNNTPSTNLFVSNTTTNSIQKPAAFTFGSSTPFNAPSSTPAFGSNTAPAPNIFGISSPNNNQSSVFTSPVQNQPRANIFGSPAAPSNANNPIMFGASNIGTTPTFGAPSPSMPSFDAPSHSPAPAPAFNFGAAPSTGVFGFGQQAQAPQAPQAVYSFGGGSPSAAAPQVQFNMGSGAVRRVRKAVRRNTPR